MFGVLFGVGSMPLRRVPVAERELIASEKCFDEELGNAEVVSLVPAALERLFVAFILPSLF